MPKEETRPIQLKRLKNSNRLSKLLIKVSKGRRLAERRDSEPPRFTNNFWSVL